MNIPTSTMASEKAFPIEVIYLFLFFEFLKKVYEYFFLFIGRLLIALKTDLSDSIDTAPSEVENMPTQTINEVSTYSQVCNKWAGWGEFFVYYIEKQGVGVNFLFIKWKSAQSTVWPEPIWIKVKKSWLLLPQHQRTYLGGPESASIEIPPFRPHFKKI